MKIKAAKDFKVCRLFGYESKYISNENISFDIKALQTSKLSLELQEWWIKSS